MAEIVELTDADGTDLLESGTVLVDFWATWCAPCRLAAPAVKSVGERFAENLTVVKVDVDLADQLRERYGVLSVPTLVLLQDGIEIAREFGPKSAQYLADLVGRHITHGTTNTE